MILNDLLGLEVRDDTGAKVGKISDARFILETSPGGTGPGQARLLGFLVSPRGKSSYLGYERSRVNSPWLIARIMAWHHRGSFLIRWADIESVEKVVTMRPGYTKAPSPLP